jgi:hypothetical protein
MLTRYAVLQAMCESGHLHRVGSLHLAAEDLDPALDEEEEIAEAEAELDGIRAHKGYWPKIRDKLLSVSSSQDAEQAVREWTYGSMWVDKNGVCELCGYHPIKYHFQIVNQITRNSLVVGSECIYNYLKIPGIPDPAILKKRLNQLRTRMEATTKGLSSEDNLRLFQEVELMERALYQRIQALASPDKDFDAKAADQVVVEIIRLYNSLGFVPTTAFKTCQEADRTLVKLVRFSGGIAKRSKKLQGHGMVDTVQAVMRLRADEDKKANLSRMKELIDDLGRLGSLAEIVDRGWGALRESRQDIIAQIEKDLRAAVQQLEERYADELAYLKHYEYLYFTLKVGLGERKDELTKSARSVIDFIQSDEFLEGSHGSRVPTFSPQSTLGEGQNPHVRSAAQVAKVVDVARSGLRWIAETLDRKGYVLSPADLVRIWLECLDEGVLDLGEPADKLLDKFGTPGIQAIVRKIAPEALPPEGMTVAEAMTQAWGVDVEAAWKRMSADNNWEANFAEDLTYKFLAGRQRTLTFNQRGVIKKKLQLKPVANSVWEALKAKLTASYRQDRFANVETQTRSYGR